MKKSSIFHALFCALFSLSKTVFPFQHPERKFKRHFAFSLVEMLMALLVASLLLADFAGALKGKKNDRGGIFRAGTGTAMYYLWHAASWGLRRTGAEKGNLSAPISLPAS